MRFTTEMYLGIRNVGDKEDQGMIWFEPLQDLIKRIIWWLEKTTPRKRIVIALSSDRQQVVNQLAATQTQEPVGGDAVFAEVLGLMERAAVEGLDDSLAGNPTDPLDDYVP